MLTVAGAGPGNPKYLTYQVRDKIIQADKVIAFGRIAKDLQTIRKDIMTVKTVSQVLHEVDHDKDCLLLASGDPLFYGIVNYLKRNKVSIDRIMPGLSSIQYMMASLQLDWQDAYLTSCHGRDLPVDKLMTHPKSVLLLDKKHTPTMISTLLYHNGARGHIYIGSHLSYEQERIDQIEIGQEYLQTVELGLMVIIHETN